MHTTDPYEDQFEKREKARNEGIAKNEYQRLKNVAKSMKGGKVKGKRVIKCGHNGNLRLEDTLGSAILELVLLE